MSQKKCVHLLIFNGFADWEPAYAISEINKRSNYQLVTVAFQQSPIISMGGLRILPDMMINEIDYRESELFILPGGHMWEQDFIDQVLPGGYMWEQNSVDEIVPVIENYHNNHIPIAAISEATLFLADHGYLNNTPHTSNQLNYLKTYSLNYQGDRYYQDTPCVQGDDFITANGTAPLEFARAIFDKLNLFNTSDLDQWYKMYKNGNRH